MRISRRVANSSAAISRWVTGDAWTETLAVSQAGVRARIDTVSFAPGARTVWHRHQFGQLLIVTAAPAGWRAVTHPPDVATRTSR